MYVRKLSRSRDYSQSLAEWLDLPKHLPKRHKIEEVGLGRNCTLFDFLRYGAYRTIKKAKVECIGLDCWRATINGRALSRNGDFLVPLDGKEVWQTAKSVADWTWRRFDIAASDERFSALQAHRGRQGGRPRTTTANGEPWKPMGISKSTWYRWRDMGHV